MTDLREHLWQKASERLFITREQFDADLESWDIEPIRLGAEVIGVALRRGAEFHFTSLGTGRSLTRALLRDILRPQLERYGFIVTRTPKEEARQRRFNEAIGFVATGEDELDVHYRLERVRPCQQ